MGEAGAGRGATRRAGSRRGLAGSVGLCVFLAIALTNGRDPMRVDAEFHCAAARSVVDHGLPDLPPDVNRSGASRSPGGRYYPVYSLLPILQCVPAVLIESGVRWFAPADSVVERYAEGLVPAAVAGLLAAAFWLLALELGIGPGVATAATFALVFATPIWIYGRLLYGENLQALLVVGSLALWLRARRGGRGALVWGGVLLGLAINAKTPLAILPVAVLVDQLWGRPSFARLRTVAGWGGLGAAPGVLLFLAYNVERYGDPFNLGYTTGTNASIGFGTPLAVGLYGLLLSSGKSLFLYAPPALAALFAMPAWWREHRRDVVFFAIPFVFVLVSVAKWWAWSGDWCWGPRLLVPVLPLLFIPLLYAMQRSRGWRAAVAGLAALGVVVQVGGIAVDFSHYLAVTYKATQNRMKLVRGQPPVRDYLAVVHFVPEFTPVVGHYWLVSTYWNGWNGRGDWYPWRGIGIHAWRLRVDPRPKSLNFWFDASPPAWGLALGTGGALALAGWRLRRSLRA